jgi:phage major head subunit gpT-like protein
MALTREQFIELEGNIQKVFDAYFKEKKDYLPKMFNVTTSTRAQETHFGIGAMGRMTDWAGTVAYDALAKGYEKAYRHGKKSTGLQIERELYDDKEYEQIKARTNRIAYGVQKTLQVDGASVFNNAFNTNYTGPDGDPLCDADHKIVPGADDQSNTNTLDMTVDNLETVLNNMRAFEDDRGDIMDVQGDLIICGTYWAKTVKQIVGSKNEAYTADNQVNVYSDLIYLVNPYITVRKWFVVATDLMKGGDGLNWFMRRDPRKLERDSDFDTEVLKWKAVARYSYGWNTWAWIYGNNPA